MPELPEVETIRKELEESICGKKIASVKQYYPNTCMGKLNPATIKNINRKGKYLIIETSRQNIVIHLRMTGKLIFANNLTKHTRAEFIFTDESKLLFDDIRTFGKIEFLPKNKYSESILKLGKEPLDKGFNAAYLLAKLKNRKSCIKTLLLNQSIIAGLGNIYVCEILYRAKINPNKLCQNLTRNNIEEIVKHTKQVIAEAIDKNGTTISDYRRVDDKTGSFQNFLRVYQKTLCPLKHEIKKIKQAGRTTYYCPVCQK